jgi:AMP-polyphosphate phosphotransferase
MAACLSSVSRDFAQKPNGGAVMTRLMNLNRVGRNRKKIIKIFLHVTADTQDKVLTERLDDLAKRWKVTAEDFRNREKRADYLVALKDMFKRTHTHWAPWTVIDGNNQKAARIAVLTHVIAELEKSLTQEFPDANPDIVTLAQQAIGYSAKG